MKNLLTYGAVLTIGIASISCSVKKTEDGELPEITVKTEAGELPEYDVEWASVDVSTRTKIIKVPKLVVVMEEEEVEVPYVDFDMPSAGDKEERTINVEIELEKESHDLKITEAYVHNDKIVIISELEATGEDLGEQTMRVSDRIILNVPEDLSVRHYIIGNKPVGEYNGQYKFVNSKEDIKYDLSKAKRII